MCIRDRPLISRSSYWSRRHPVGSDHSLSKATKRHPAKLPHLGRNKLLNAKARLMVRIHSSSEISHENLSRLDTSKKGKIFEISSSCGIWPKQRRGLSTNSQARDITRSDLSNGGGSLGGLARPNAACGGAAVLRPTCPDLSPVLNEDYFPAGANHSDSKTPPILFNQQHRNPQTADRQGQRRQTPRKPCILRIPVNDRQIH